ncbi:putative short-chain dehydrogenases/reductase [Bisporella sp. PMI_857]|nr:putative short-chain dehydrogenases/reductase [Bisporella sp. PMI_857]
MAIPKQTVLITGCSDGSLGAALAVAFHKAGLHVYATSRNPSKMAHLASLGIETLTLDVLSDNSIAECVSKIPSLDILVNNAGSNAMMPVADLSIPEAKKLFDLNVWSYLAVTQAFLPLLLKSKGMIVNQTSIASVTSVPFQSTYTASKAAIAMYSDAQRLELAPFGIRVVDLKTGVVKSNLVKAVQEGNLTNTELPKDSIYAPAREVVEKALRHEGFVNAGIDGAVWAKAVVGDLLRKNVPPIIWRGENAWLAWVATMLPFGMLDSTVKQMTGMDIVEKILQC